MISAVPTEEHWLQQIRKLTDVSRALTYAASLEEVLQLTAVRAADLLGAEKSLILVTNDDGLLSLRSSHGIEGSVGEAFREPLSEALLTRLATLLRIPHENFIGVPLVVDGAIRGLLVVIRPDASTAAEHDEWVLSALADQAAVALDKTHLGEIAEFREQLIGVVGHDLRNPLNTILMAANIMMQHEGLGQKETDLARRIARSATLAARLIDQLLDLTRSRLGGGIPVDPKPFDMNEVVEQLVSETELAHAGRRLRVDARGDLTGVWDRDRLYHLLGNLVGNAVQHGEPRTMIELRVHGRESEVVIEVASQGEPIPPSKLPYIFEAFRKGRTTHSSTGQGSGLGLGLFIAQQIARAHGGAITATSSKNDGTVFRVRLPRETVAATSSRA